MNDCSFLSLAKKRRLKRRRFLIAERTSPVRPVVTTCGCVIRQGMAAESLAFQGENSIRQNFSAFFKISLDKFKSCDIIILVRVTRTKTKTEKIAGLCKGSTADSDSVCEGSNPSPAATEKSETVRFWTSFFLLDLLSDPLTVLQLLSTDGVLHIGFHSICTVLFHLL